MVQLAGRLRGESNADNIPVTETIRPGMFSIIHLP